jgi:hypothetical protein
MLYLHATYTAHGIYALGQLNLHYCRNFMETDHLGDQNISKRLIFVFIMKQVLDIDKYEA